MQPLVKVKQLTVYECPICHSEHETSLLALECSKTHAQEQRIKAWETALLSSAKEIVAQARNFNELCERIEAWSREFISPDIQCILKSNGGLRTDKKIWMDVSMTYVISAQTSLLQGRKFISWGENSRKQINIDSSRILQLFGINTGCGNGDGNKYHWQATAHLDSYPTMMAELESLKQLHVETNEFANRLEQNVNHVCRNHPDIMRSNTLILEYEDEIDDLNRKIALERETIRQAADETVQAANARWAAAKAEFHAHPVYSITQPGTFRLKDPFYAFEN